MIKKLLILVTAVALVATTAVASDNSLFNGKELSVSAAASSELTSANLTEVSLGAGYFVTKNFGLEVGVPVYKTEGTSIQNVSFGGVARVPVLKHFAPFVRVGADYNWQSDNFSEYVGAGVEARINSKWGVFGGVDYNIESLDKFKDGTFVPQVGVRFVF